jgi:hypothetical protein
MTVEGNEPRFRESDRFGIGMVVLRIIAWRNSEKF